MPLHRAISAAELEHLEHCAKCHGHFFYYGRPFSCLTWEIERLRRLYGVPAGFGLDIERGVWIEPMHPEGKPVRAMGAFGV